MKPEAKAEVILETGGAIPASPVGSYGFIVSFGDESFSSAVVPDGSVHLEAQKVSRVCLRFLVPEAQAFLKPGAEFTFFEQGRIGHGRLL